MQKEPPVRKNLRLKEYDYSQAGCYFVTVCTFAREEIFGKIFVGSIHESTEVYLSPAGNIVASVLSKISARYPSIDIKNFVIMPNHLHMIVAIREKRPIRESTLRTGGKRSLLSQMIGYMKMNVTKQIREQNLGIYDVWQSRYHDQIIRNETDYRCIGQYIDENPARWPEDEYYAKENPKWTSKTCLKT